MFNVLLTKFSYFVVAIRVFIHDWVVFNQKRLQNRVFQTIKYQDTKSTLRYFLENLAHTNPNIPSKLYRAKRWCILLEGRSQCTWIRFTSSSELKSSSPLTKYILLSFQPFTSDFADTVSIIDRTTKLMVIKKLNYSYVCI